MVLGRFWNEFDARNNKKKPQAGAGPAVCMSQRSRKIPHRQPCFFQVSWRKMTMVPSYRPRLGSPCIVPGDGPRLRIINSAELLKAVPGFEHIKAHIITYNAFMSQNLCLKIYNNLQESFII